MASTTSDVAVLPAVDWTSPPLAMFDAMASGIEARFGPPSVRDADSNGIGLFDCHCLRFACGLEVALSRFHLGARMHAIDPLIEPSIYEVHANNRRDLAHIAFHVGVPVESMAVWTSSDGSPAAVIPQPSVIVMRVDDNGIEAEVKRVTNRCEAEALVRDYEARGHKQTYWIADARPDP